MERPKALVRIKREEKKRIRLARFKAKVMQKAIGRAISTGFGLNYGQ